MGSFQVQGGVGVIKTSTSQYWNAKDIWMTLLEKGEYFKSERLMTSRHDSTYNSQAGYAFVFSRYIWHGSLYTCELLKRGE